MKLVPSEAVLQTQAYPRNATSALSSIAILTLYPIDSPAMQVPQSHMVQVLGRHRGGRGGMGAVKQGRQRQRHRSATSDIRPVSTVAAQPRTAEPERHA